MLGVRPSRCLASMSPVRESYDPVPDSYLYSQFRPEVSPMAPSSREQRRLRVCSGELQLSSTRPLDALCCSSLNYHDDVVDIAAGRHPAEVVYKG